MQYLHGQHKHWKSISHIDDMQSQSDEQHFPQPLLKSRLKHRQQVIMTNINPKKEKITAIEILSGAVSLSLPTHSSARHVP